MEIQIISFTFNGMFMIYLKTLCPRKIMVEIKISFC